MSNIKSIVLAGFAVAAIVSCTKASVAEQPVREHHPDYVKMSFSLNVEQSKTTVDELGHVSWVENDSVKVIWDGGSAVGKVNADCTLEVEAAVADAYYAVYPAETEAVLNVDGSLLVTIPSTVDGSFASANIMAAKAVNDDFCFKHVCGIVKVQMPSGYKKVEIRANDTNGATGGTSTVTFDAEGAVTVVTAEAAAKASSASATEFEEGPVYIPVRSDVEWSCGVIMRFHDTASNIKAALSLNSVTMARGKMLNMGKAVSRVHDWYIKENGTGDGSDWDHAGGPDLIVKLLSKNIWRDGKVIGTFDGYPNSYRIHNRKIYIAAGTYDMVDNGAVLTMNYASETNLEIRGGFSPDATGKDLSSYDPETYKTCFTANHAKKSASTRMFNGQGTFRTFRFKGIHFSNLPETCSGARGAVIYFNNSAQCATATKYHGVIFDDCFFENNTIDGYGLIDANFKPSDKTEYGKVEFNNCVFRNNKSTRSDTADYCGTAVFGSESSSTAARFNDCLFENNEAQGKNGRGAAIALLQGKVYINRCTFRNNRGQYAADIYLSDKKTNDAWQYYTSRCYINRSSFEGYSISATKNDSNYFGFSIIGYQKNTTICLNNCSFGGYGTNGTNYGSHVNPRGNGLIVNSTIIGEGTQLLRPDTKDANGNKCFIINNALIHASNGNPINQNSGLSQNGYYNLLKAGKNAYATIAETDDNYGKYENFSGVTWVDNHWEWTLSTAYPNRPTAAQVEALVAKEFPDFDEWLKTVDEKPYSIDIRGNARNEAKLQPGSWDPGL